MLNKERIELQIFRHLTLIIFWHFFWPKKYLLILTWRESKWSLLIMLSSIKNIDNVRTVATICFRSTAILSLSLSHTHTHVGKKLKYHAYKNNNTHTRVRKKYSLSLSLSHTHTHMLVKKCIHYNKISARW